MFHNDGEGANDRAAEKRARCQVGTYVRIFGNVSPSRPRSLCAYLSVSVFVPVSLSLSLSASLSVLPFPLHLACGANNRTCIRYFVIVCQSLVNSIQYVQAVLVLTPSR